MDRENFARFPYQNFDFQPFKGAAGIGAYMLLLTDEQEQRGSLFNYYGSQIFPQAKLTSSIADASAGAGQNKKQYETLCRKLSGMPRSLRDFVMSRFCSSKDCVQVCLEECSWFEWTCQKRAS